MGRTTILMLALVVLTACSGASVAQLQDNARAKWIGKMEDDLMREKGQAADGTNLLNGNRLWIYREQREETRGAGRAALANFFGGMGAAMQKQPAPAPVRPRTVQVSCETRYEVSANNGRIINVFMQGDGCQEE